MKDIVAIVGSHPLSRGDFDFNRTDCEVWVFNEAMATDWCKRADAVFQMHVPTIWKNPLNRNDPGHGAWLMSGDTPDIYMMEAYQEVPRAVKYPLDEVIQLLGRFNYKKYLTSSVAMAIALAVYRGYKKIELYGIGMETETEYFYQRDCVSFWTGFALGRGIEVEAHRIEIFNTLLYGYEGNISIDNQKFEEKLIALEPAIKEKTAQYLDAQQKTNEAISRFSENPDNIEEIVALVKQQVVLASEFGIFDGSYQENKRYIDKISTMKKETGEHLISRQEFEAARGQYAVEHDRMLAQANAISGKLNALLDEAKRTPNKVKRRAKVQNFINALNDYVKASTALGMYMGAAHENVEYMNELDKMIRAAGGEKSFEVLGGSNG